MNRSRPTTGKPGWSQSAQFRAIGRAAIREWNAKRDRLPRCGATRKSDGEPCQQWPMENGRCYLHGGRTPRGDCWHRLQAAADARKNTRKLKRQQWVIDDRAERVAAMSPAEREKHKDWQRTHRPGSASGRAAERERRRQARDGARLLNSATCDSRSANAEALAVDRTLTELRRWAEELSARLADSGYYTGGVFD